MRNSFFLIQFLIKELIFNAFYLRSEEDISSAERKNELNSTAVKKGGWVYLPIQFHLEGRLNQRVRFKCFAFVG